MASKTIVSAFSFNMVPLITSGNVKFRRLTKEEVAMKMATENWIPGIGHADTAKVVATDLGACSDLFARTTLVVNPGDELLLAQYAGPRLPEGATSLPIGARIDYLHITIE